MKLARTLIVGVIGTTLILVGVVLIFTPGPAILVLAVGLSVLGVEFAWARRLLRKIKAKASSALPSRESPRQES